jgi:hypothetical protein
VKKHNLKIITEDLRIWSREYLEIPNVHLNKMPACPFAKQAWKDEKVVIDVRNIEKGYTRNLDSKIREINWNKKEILIFCDLSFKEYSLNKFQAKVDRFNNKYNKKDLYFMGFHPRNPANDEDQAFLVEPNGDRESLPKSDLEYSMMLVQKFSQLYYASVKLHKMGYYKLWPKDYYDDVVTTRQMLYEQLNKGAKK